MLNASELLQLAANSRDSATRAHRLAGTINEADSIRLQSYRDQLLAEAADLERQAAAMVSAGADAGTLLEQRQQEQQPQQTRTTEPKKLAE
jgi:hypothetical protein